MFCFLPWYDDKFTLFRTCDRCANSSISFECVVPFFLRFLLGGASMGGAGAIAGRTDADAEQPELETGAIEIDACEMAEMDGICVGGVVVVVGVGADGGTIDDSEVVLGVVVALDTKGWNCGKSLRLLRLLMLGSACACACGCAEWSSGCGIGGGCA